jgi:hypothetical protein
MQGVQPMKGGGEMFRGRVGLLVVLLCVVLTGAAWAAARSVGLYVNGYPVQARAIVVDGVTYVPLRAVAEALDCSVSYEPSVGVSIWRQPQPTVTQVAPANPAPVAPAYQYPSYTQPAAPLVTPTPTPAPSPSFTLPSLPKTAEHPLVAENGSSYGEISKDTGRPKDVYVNGYYRKDGTYVRGHYRSSPRRR